MGIEVRINDQIINRGKPNRFALERVLIESGVSNEYLINGKWVTGAVKSKPDEKRIVFNDVSQFRAARDVYFAWIEIQKLKQYKPELPVEIMSRLYSARVNQMPLVLFTPWGFRSSGDFGPERIVLGRLSDFEKMLAQKGIPTQSVIMPADLYASEINGIDSKEVEQYFSLIANEVQSRGFRCIPWSTIREESRIQYQKLKTELTEDRIRAILTNQVIDSALSAAEKRVALKTKAATTNSAFAYLRERICEAIIIDELWRPIKISGAAVNKDNGVDMNLPRLYILPAEEQFPWLK